MAYVQSSALEQVAYDEPSQTLSATFRDSGRTYIYRDVPQEVYDRLIFAESIGAFFNAHIRDRFHFEDIGA
jgi:hypothetical protein